MLWEQIPNELKMNSLWCCWKLSEKGKVPYDALTGKGAKTNDESTFHPFLTALSALPKYQGFNEHGVSTGGLGIGLFYGFSGIDIDHCRDAATGKLTEMAQEIIDFCASYTEISPSGEGIHILFKTDFHLDKEKYLMKNSKIGLEVYISNQTNRFLTLTGNTLISNNKIAKFDIKYIMEKYMLKNTGVNKVATPKYEVNISLAQALNKDNKLSSLWNETAPGAGANESELDFALCCKLAFYLKGDYEAINEAFISSPYYLSKDEEHVKKWQRIDYREQTIKNAILSNGEMRIRQPNKYELTDTGNSRYLFERYGNIIKYNVDFQKWMIFNGKFWQIDIYNNVKTLAESVAEEMKQSAFMIDDEDKQKAVLKNVNKCFNSSGKESMLRETQHIPGIPCTNNDYDKEKFYLNTKSGVVDLRTGVIMPHDKNLMQMKYIDLEVDMRNEPKIFVKFMREIFENDNELIKYMLKAFGYALTGSMKEQCVFFLVGDGANGKSVLLQVLNEIAGDYSESACSDLLLDKKFQSNNKSELAGLKGKRIIITTETNPGERLNEAQLKSMSAGNDEIVACRKYGNEFSYYPEYKVFMATNHLPVMRGMDHGLWRRMRTIPFRRTFSENEQDRNLIEKLRKEFPQILGMLIKYAKLWYEEGLTPPQKIIDTNTEYKTEMDIVQKWIDECCIISGDMKTQSSNLFNSFCSYIAENKEWQLTNTLFGRNLSKKFTKKRLGNSIFYIGIGLRELVICDDKKHKNRQYEY